MTRRNERGAILVLTAISLTTLLLFTSIAIDLGYQRVARRDMQALADVVALDVVRIVDGRTEAQVVAGGSGQPSLANAVTQSVARNDDTAGTHPDVTAVLGTVDSQNHFTACPCTVPTAVKVTAETEVDYFFRPGTGGARRSAVAVRAKNNSAAFLVGSSLVSVTPQSSSAIGQLLNAVVPGASALGYQGLANANISLEALGSQLHLPLTAMSPDELLDTNVSYRNLVVAAAAAAQESGQTAAVTALNNFLALQVPNTQINLGEALGVSAGDASPAISGKIALSTLLLSSVYLVDGEHAVTIPGTTLQIPGIGSVVVKLTGIEAPQRGGDDEGASATTRQLHLEVTPQIAISNVNPNVCNALPVPERQTLGNLLGWLLGTLLDLVNCLTAKSLTFSITASPTFNVDLAAVTVSQHIDCANKQLVLTPQPSAITVHADIDAAVTVTIGGGLLGKSGQIQLIKVHVPAGFRAPPTGTTVSPVTFTAQEPGRTTDFGYIWETFSPTMGQVGTSPLGLDDLVKVGGSSFTVLNQSLPTLATLAETLVVNTLNPVLGQLDTVLLQPLAQALGLRLAGSDMTPLYLRCDQSSVALAG